MIEDVIHYVLGEHRTGTPTDEATSQWMAGRLSACGMTVELQRFPRPLFTPTRCDVELGETTIAAFPAWPVVATPDEGLTAALVLGHAETQKGCVAVVRSPRPGASWATPGLTAAVMGPLGRGASAVIMLTDGPTGEIIALNAVRDLAWLAPVVVAGGGEAPRLEAAAGSGSTANLRSIGSFQPEATAANVIARREGRGPAIVVSTPKSGWFQCAGERGTGIAVFLALAEWLPAATSAPLVFIGFTGHELDFEGAVHLLGAGTLASGDVRLWLHIGANAGMRDLGVDAGSVVERKRGEPFRRVTVSEQLLPHATQAFSAEAGYAPPVAISARNAPGEMSLVHPAGYGPIIALGGSNPLFHTPRDRADVVTTEGDLTAVTGATKAFLSSVIGLQP